MKFSKLFASSLIFTFQNIHPSGNFKGKHQFKPLCWDGNETCDVQVSIDHTGYHSKKNCRKTTTGTLQVFFVLFTWPISLLGIYGTLLLLVMLLSANSCCYRQERKGKHSLHGVAGLTDWQTAFAQAQGGILQSRDFNLRGEQVPKIPFPQS